MKSMQMSSDKAPSLGMPSPPKADKLSAEFTLPAGRPLALNALIGEGRWTCEVTVRVTLQPGRDYEMEYLLSRTAGRCMTPLRELKPGAKGVERVRVAGAQALKPGQSCGRGALAAD